MNPLRILAVLVAFCFTAALSAQDETRKVQRAKIVKLDVDKMTIKLKVDAKDLDLLMTEETNILGARGANLKEKLQGFKDGAEIQFVQRAKDGKNYLVAIKLFDGAAKDPAKKRPLTKFDSSKLVPLNELKGEYQGFKGGFYPDGANDRPKEHEAAGLRLAKEIQPLNADGKIDPQGKIVLLSIGMSNTTQASQGFKQVLASASKINPRFLFVDGAVGGQTAMIIQNLDSPQGAKYWAIVDQRLENAKLSRAQVQAIWIKEADAGPNQGFPGYAKKLEDELAKIVQIFPKRFPNVKMVYLSSRTYGGYATSSLNPEPYAYESGFSVKWLIERQIKGDAALNFDPKKGDVTAPWLSWGPYLWANGATKRADGFSYEKSDFRANDGTHLTPACQEKVGRLMLQFFQSDTTTRPWFKAQR